MKPADIQALRKLIGGGKTLIQQIIELSYDDLADTSCLGDCGRNMYES